MYLQRDNLLVNRLENVRRVLQSVFNQTTRICMVVLWNSIAVAISITEG